MNDGGKKSVEYRVRRSPSGQPTRLGRNELVNSEDEWDNKWLNQRAAEGFCLVSVGVCDGVVIYVMERR